MQVSAAQLHNLTWMKGDWCFPSQSKETDELLRQCLVRAPIDDSEDIVSEIIAKSNAFPVHFPIETVRLHKLKDVRPDASYKRNIISTYPIIHERVLLLIASFIVYKREFGSSIEKALYKDMSISELVDRMLKKRSVTFCGPRDLYKLLSGEEGQDGWESVGTLQQKPPLLLESCLSYDEMRLSAMLYVTGRTEFVNDGGRYNEGVSSSPDAIEREGVIMGLIGPRLERRHRMEYEETLISEQQNIQENGYGEEVTPRTCVDLLKTTYVRNNQSGKLMWRQMWAEFYQVPSYTYEEVRHLASQPHSPGYRDRFVPRPNSTDLIDNEVLFKRLSVPFDCALLEANERAKEDGKMAYLNVVGIGLGVWRVSLHQADVLVLTFLERLKSLMAAGLVDHVADVNFAYIKPGEEIAEMIRQNPLLEGCKHPNGGVRVHLVSREPSSRLPQEHAGQLLVTTYAWDGNAHPGNEFWMGSLSGSGDPAAACSTQVAELHNAHINCRYVSASNLRVAGQYGLLPLHEYTKRLLDDR